MRFDTLSGAVALMALGQSVAADPLNIKIHSRRTTVTKPRTMSKRSSAGTISINNWFENFDLQVSLLALIKSEGRLLTPSQWYGEVEVGTPPQKQ